MKWPWTRHRSKEPEGVAPEQPTPEQLAPEPFLQSQGFGLEEHVVAATNVMAIRDAINVFLFIVREHREDGHDCPPYCVPSQMDYFLQVMDEDDLRWMLVVLLKDMVEMYLRQMEAHE